MNTERKAVDVLALMESAASTCEAYTAKTVFRGGDAGFVREFSDGGLREARAVVAELIEKSHRLEVASNTVGRCYTHRPENFAAALRAMRDAADDLRGAIARVGGA